MRITLLFAIASAFAAAQDLGDRGAIAPQNHNPHSGYTFTSRPVDTPATEVCLGDVAPDVSYQAIDARWRRLHDLVADHPALLVFGADDAALASIERERNALLDRGVLPVAVMGSRLGATRSLVQRLDLKFTVLADPQGVIASQFNAIDPASGHQMPAWFVLDSGRRVRALGRSGLPGQGWTTLAAEALGLPPATATVPASR